MVTAVITGASSGLGKEYINAIIEQYPSVDAFWLIARRKELLKEIAVEHPDKTVAAISLDLSKDESLDIFEQLLKENSPEIKVLVNNAGFGKCEDFFASNRRAQTDMVDLNCRALTCVTRLCMPYMLDDSLVINVASIAAFAPTPRMSVYAATKSFVLSLSKALHDELRPRGIKVLAVCPGPMETEFWKVANVPEGKSRLIDKLPRVSAPAVAVGSLKAAKRGKLVYTNSFFYKLYRLIGKLLPHGFLMQFTEV
ncbi:MAG: SDR family NAD(P)-dependent oxidoreductase [Acutalibacter sp.]|uniref:SDR family NAD(P)-dependent oxidoreductase n=1 Tax=unclassified Acutalibacter TaxID=2620728 RepID=UPI002172E67D|nr:MULTISPECIES: SDR family NAD(P)-dependent oxidoreductase [unclassified Acutalibacter]MCI9224121.1 SDR family NAD(P)-dependent oxidoreductase [Acutalibacter sp.]